MNNEYYKKYLKYKTKYLQLLKQSGGYPIGAINKPIDAIKPWYNLDNHTLFCTSDLEGGNPFKDLRSSSSISKEVTDALNKAFMIDRDGNITRLKDPNTAFAFLGDLLDNNPFSIRLMERMINLKETFPNKVILLGGNRDFNKIRMGIELFLQTVDSHPITKDKGLPWDKTTNMTELLNRLRDVKFEFRHEGIPEYLDGVGEWDKIISDRKLDMYNDKTKISERLKSMYANTLGIKDGTKHMITELGQMCGIRLSDYSDEVVDKLLCTIHMVMAFDWSGVKLPAYLSRFNGLYQKYLTLCHVIAGFTMNGKVGILSHGSMPINTIDGTNRSLTHPFGYYADHRNFMESNETKLARENRELQQSTNLTKADTINISKIEDLNTDVEPKQLTREEKLAQLRSGTKPAPVLKPLTPTQLEYLSTGVEPKKLTTQEKIEILRSQITPAPVLKPLTPTQLEGLRTNIKSKPSSLISVILMIELEKIELIKEYQKLRYTPYTYKDFPMVTKFVHLTATTKDSKYPEASSQNSPVVWGNQQKDLTKYPDISLRLVGASLSGGAPGFENWVNNDKPKSHHILDNGQDKVHYNIFGHSPAYFNPIYNRKNHTLHVNLDVSKAEAQSNLASFAFLVINRKETKLIGRIQFTQIDNNNADGSVNYKNNTGYATEEIRRKLSGHDHYYSHQIPETSNIGLSMNDNILGLPYKAGRGEGYNKLIK